MWHILLVIMQWNHKSITGRNLNIHRYLEIKAYVPEKRFLNSGKAWSWSQRKTLKGKFESIDKSAKIKTYHMDLEDTPKAIYTRIL